jgi:hypothetical protein
MWIEFPWIKPRNEEELRCAETILRNLESAKKISPDIPLPYDEWRELASLLGKELIEPGRHILQYPTRIGYRRNDIIASYPNGWEVPVPGYFIQDTEEDTDVYKDDLRSVRLNTYTADDNYQFIFSEELEKPCKSNEKMLLYQEEHFDYKAKGYWMLQGQIMSPSSMAIVTITWQTESFSEWAISTFKNIKGPNM